MLSMIMVLSAAAGAAFATEPRREVMGRADLPPKVEDTFERESGGRGLEQIRLVVDPAGHKSYVARVVGTGRIVEVAADGSLRWVVKPATND
jgi:hypothetical protein